MAAPDIVWPVELRPLTVSWTLLEAGAAVRATSGKIYTADYGFGLWRCTAMFQGDVYKGNLPIGEVEGLLAQMSGQRVVAAIPRWDRSEGPRGGITLPKPRAVNHGEVGNTLNVNGVTGVNPVFRAGDVFGYKDFMYMITEDIERTEDTAQLVFKPALKAPSVQLADVRFMGLNWHEEWERVRTNMVVETFSSPDISFRAPNIGQVTVQFLETTY